MKVHPVSSIRSVILPRTVAPWLIMAAKVSLVISMIVLAPYLLKKRFFPSGDGTLKLVPFGPIQKNIELTAPPVREKGDGTPKSAPFDPIQEKIELTASPVGEKDDGTPKSAPFDPIQENIELTAPPVGEKDDGTPKSAPFDPIQEKIELTASPVGEKDDGTPKSASFDPIQEKIELTAPPVKEKSNAKQNSSTPESIRPLLKRASTWPSLHEPPSTPLTPRMAERKALLSWLQKLVTNPPPIKDQPVFIREGDAKMELTEALLTKLEGFFANFNAQTPGDDSSTENPFLCCHLLEQNPQAYQWRAADDKARIRALLENYQKAQALISETPALKKCFFVNFPVTFQKLDEINQFLEQFLALEENRLTWLQANYKKEIYDPFYWCDFLEKKHPSTPENETLQIVLDKYNRARLLMSKDSQLSVYIYMDPFEVTIDTKIITLDWGLLVKIKNFPTELKTDIAFVKKYLETSEYTLQDYENICNSLWNNQDVYHARPLYLRDFISSITLDYFQNKHRLQRCKKSPVITKPKREPMETHPISASYPLSP